MGYYGINQAEIRRDTREGRRVIVVRVFIEDIGPAGQWETKIFDGWESLPRAMVWAESQLAQLSM